MPVTAAMASKTGDVASARSAPAMLIRMPAEASVARRPIREARAAAMTPLIAALSRPMVSMTPMAPAVRPRRSRWRPMRTAAIPKPKARSSRAARMRAKSRRTGVKSLRLVLTPGVERVVHRRFELNLFLIALAKHQREASGNGAQPCGLGRDLHIVGHVGAVDDTGQLRERWIGELVFADDRFEAATSVDMAELDVRHVIGNRVLARGDRHDVGGRDEQELGLGVDKSLDEPGTGNTIDVRIRAGDVFHDRPAYLQPNLN